MSRSNKRVGLGNYRKELTLPKGLIKTGYKGRWVNDDGDRLQQAQDSGYEFVLSKKDTHVGEDTQDGNSDLGTRISKVADKTPRLVEPMRVYLMQIKQSWYEEDQKAKLEKVETIDSQIKQGGHGIKSEEDSFYNEMKYKT